VNLSKLCRQGRQK